MRQYDDDADASEALMTVTGTEPRQATHRSWLRSLSLDAVGVAGGAVALLLSLTPSLLPRDGMLQGIVSGLSFGIGYAVTVGVWRLARRWSGWQPPVNVRRWLKVVGWPLFAVVFIIAAVGGVLVQDEVRRMVELPPMEGVAIGAFAVSLLLVSGLCLGIGWLVRFTWRRGLRRLEGRGLAKGNAQRLAMLRTVVVLAIALGLLWSLLFFGLDRIYLASNGKPAAGLSEPDSEFRSAGVGSEVKFDELGRQGGDFITGGPTAEQISELTGRPALTPIRVYVGTAAGGTMEERAQIAVRELERTGAFEREVLVVATPTGSGWLEPQAVDAVEFLHSGDTAIAALQYAYTPSFVSSLTAPHLPIEATTALFDAVHARWQQLPEGGRPELVVYGLSLGSQGILNSFGTLDALLEKTDGVLLVGPTNTTPLWRELQASRDAGSAPWRPVRDEGRRVRWASGFGDFQLLPGAWDSPRVAILQHATDPITWLGPELLWQRPEWLTNGNRAPDVSPHMHWIPGVTAVQVSLDMAMSVAVPARHGHAFGDVMLQGWVAVTGDGGLGEAALRRVQQELETYWPISPYTR